MSATRQLAASGPQKQLLKLLLALATIGLLSATPSYAAGGFTRKLLNAPPLPKPHTKQVPIALASAPIPDSELLGAADEHSESVASSPDGLNPVLEDPAGSSSGNRQLSPAVKCNKCFISLNQGGCKCDGSCDCIGDSSAGSGTSTPLYAYTGCYVDFSDDDDSQFVNGSGYKTVEECASDAAAAGSDAFAMQYPQGSSAPGVATCLFSERARFGSGEFAAKPDSECNVVKWSEPLGGSKRNAVYIMRGTTLSQPLDIRRITCPVMAALVKNGDLVTNAKGEVTKAQVAAAMRTVGMPEDILTSAADKNFDHLPEPKVMNLFKMNTVSGGDPAGPLEHFRSTGIRDGPVPDLARYRVLASAARFGMFSQREVRDAVALFNFERQPGMSANTGSNDVFEAKRPAGCTGEDSPQMQALCLAGTGAQLLGGFIDMLKSFGSPVGENAVLSAAEMEALWMKGDYPAGFASRLPRNQHGESGNDSDDSYNPDYGSNPAYDSNSDDGSNSDYDYSSDYDYNYDYNYDYGLHR